MKNDKANAFKKDLHKKRILQYDELNAKDRRPFSFAFNETKDFLMGTTPYCNNNKHPAR